MTKKPENTQGGPNTKDYVTSVGTFPCRGLKRGEIKGLKAQGIDFGSALTCDLDFALEKTASLMLTKDQIALLLGDEIFQSVSWGFYMEVVRLSYTGPAQAKNSE